ncbi:Conserved plasma membrane protein [Caenorhabditis elegans]|uniref:Conserved plasma membrane protein n=1 Tax=Caenorhabditis elegans TaxID=6239 RepID=Q2AAC4_CAEEL|nr:Conserved plasma membrane protein [Caenorhabditis elegans]CCD68307.2 Conserved plasma membrane protein [Caenorhabditis elegans]
MLLLLLELVLPAFLLYVGISSIGNCMVDERIPVWLICIASGLFLQLILEAVVQYQKSGNRIRTETDINYTVFNLALTIVRLAMFVAIIIGYVFVFSAYSKNNQCDQLLYWTSFIYCILGLIVFAILLLVVCCVARTSS